MSRQPKLEYPQSLRILTLNCWGLKYLAKYRKERLSEIGFQLATLNPAPDIVGLQECWTQEDYHSIRDQTKHLLPYGKYYYSGIFGGGLAILSRWPIEESNMVRYPLNGRPTAFFRGDWFVGKGVACAKIRIGPGPKDVAEVFCTHLHAPYEKEPHDSYICHRTAQAWEIAKLMRGASERGHLIIGLGDFNMVPLSLAHRIIESQAPVRDVWRIVHPDSSLGSAAMKAEQERKLPIPSVSFNLAKNGTTCDSAINTWRWDKAKQKQLKRGETVDVPLDSKDMHGKRLDYIFFGSGSSAGEHKLWRVDEVSVGMTQRHSSLDCSLSDHFSVEASLSYRQVSEDVSIEARGGSQLGQVDIANSLEKAENSGQRTGYLAEDIIEEILDMTHSYMDRERRQRRLRLGHFVGGLIASIGCMIAVWWSPRNFVSFVLMLISTLSLSTGVIDGLIGGLFVGSELRALKEFEWEILNARELARQAQV